MNLSGSLTKGVLLCGKQAKLEKNRIRFCFRSNPFHQVYLIFHFIACKIWYAFDDYNMFKLKADLMHLQNVPGQVSLPSPRRLTLSVLFAGGQFFAGPWTILPHDLPCPGGSVVCVSDS